MRMVFLVLALVAISWTSAGAKCKWTVKGKVVWNNSKKPLKFQQLRVSVKEPGKSWSSARWPNPDTDKDGKFSGKSWTIWTTCTRKRDVKVELKYNGEWVKIAKKTGVKGKSSGKTVDFKTIEVVEADVVKKAGCRIVSVRLTIKIGDKYAGEGVSVALTKKRISTFPPSNLKLWKVNTYSLKGKTDKNSIFRGAFVDCSTEAKKGKPRDIHIAYRSEFHAGQQNTRIPRDGQLKHVVVFSGPYLRPRLKPTVLFRFPVEKRSIIYKRPKMDTFAGPFHMDHEPRTTATERQKGGLAYTYDGRGTLLHAYPGHEGTDFMLVGKYKRMRKNRNYVVAAAKGKIIAFKDGYYDECGLGLVTTRDNYRKDIEKTLKELLPPGIKLEDFCRGKATNYVEIEHEDGLITKYLHLKKNSVIDALKVLKVRASKLKTKQKVTFNPGIEVACGTRIGRIGSSGISVRPHLHFEVLHQRLTDDDDHPDTHRWVDPYKGKLSHWSYWVDQNGTGSLPSTKCQ